MPYQYVNYCKIRDATVGENPITFVMDNAKYQKCELVKKLAAELNIELLFLPSYSPNLNLIERLWRWVRKDCLNSKHFKHFEEFKNTINQSLQKVSKSEYKKEMDDLFTLKFQLFENEIYKRG